MTSAYINGHHESVVKAHAWRTAQNSAAYLLPILLENRHFNLLDVGCGPGTITLDFAEILSSGHVFGVDPSESVIEQAKKNAVERGIVNVTFLVGDVFDLASTLPGGVVDFDVVHSHQLVQHVQDPVSAMKSMAAILRKPGGLLACKATDIDTWAWWPQSQELERFRRAWLSVGSGLGTEQNAGRRLVAWAMKAGFERSQIQSSASAWCYSSPEERKWWGGLWAERVVASDFASTAIKSGVAERAELEDFATAWKRWVAAEDGWFGMMHGEILCSAS